MSGPPPRIPPADEVDASTQDLLSKGLHHDGEPLNAARTLARHPRLLKRFTVFAGLFLSGSVLPERHREIVTLRCAHLFGSDYYFGHHRRLAGSVLSEQEIASTVLAASDWTGFERLLIEAADEIAETWELSDTTWARLCDTYAPDQMLELVMLVGFYRMTCLFATSVGIEREPGIPGWPSERNEA